MLLINGVVLVAHHYNVQQHIDSVSNGYNYRYQIPQSAGYAISTEEQSHDVLHLKGDICLDTKPVNTEKLTKHREN